MELYRQTLDLIHKTERIYAQRAQERLDQLTKPPGSMGILEDIAVQLACIQECTIPQLGKKAVIVMAGDHGVVAEGVSAFPQEVTEQMVVNFVNHGAAINVLAKQMQAEVVIVDIGIASDTVLPGVRQQKVRKGTRNMAVEAAMTLEETIAAIETGIRLANEQIATGATLLATGEMGIGNTTPSSAIAACFSELDISVITGRGTGLDDHKLEQKCEIIRKALACNQPDRQQPLEVLQKVGGLEIAGLTGVILGAAAKKIPIVIDGFISTAAALIAYQLKPECRDYMIASHLSQEPGHRIMLDIIGMKPMLHLDLRLGEGTGAVLAFPLIEAAVSIIRDMATFEQAGVSNREV